MKGTLLLLALSIHSLCFAQNNEFEQSPNGLIYSDATVNRLKFIVDSLNLKFKVCELNKTYLSHYQAKAHYVQLDTGDIKAARADLESNMPFEDFIKKYNRAEVEKDLLVIRYYVPKNDAGKDNLSFYSMEINDKYEHRINVFENLNKYKQGLKASWIFEYHEKSIYGSEGIEAFFFPEGFIQVALPETCARMIQYADCMIDTSAQIFYDNAEESEYEPDKKKHPHLTAFMMYVDRSTRKPEWSKKKRENFMTDLQMWDSLRFFRIDSIRKSDGEFDELLKKAVDETLAKGGGSDMFEEYVERYYSPRTALDMKRNRKVYGSCSQDESPRIHALNIAKLSAQTANWEIFLRAHLNIMNDRFDRASDGSYAWGRRKTYIRELEVLDIDVPDLLLGISLRVENVSNGHYFGSISRIGRALSETGRSEEIEAEMQQMIADPKLDDYNRLLMYYLYLNFNHYQEDKVQQAATRERLMAAVKTLPLYLSEKILMD
ncbi:MAG TPA: hypothetical protein PLO67_20725 [Saprospiraceae bacterium]|nr:hypothetical protein [Saprospiraceae bacterium]HPI08693.1 hypothetical protein [Saprospiraceae bacterium]